MLSNMPKSVFNGLAALTVAIPVVAWSTLAPVHNVRASVTSLHESFSYPGTSTEHTPTSSNATFSWQDGTLHVFGNMQVTTKTDSFEFRMVRRIPSPYPGELNGEWDVFQNGMPKCAGCKGFMSVTAADSGYNSFKGWVERTDGAYYFFSGDVTSRSDY